MHGERVALVLADHAFARVRDLVELALERRRQRARQLHRGGIADPHLGAVARDRRHLERMEQAVDVVERAAADERDRPAGAVRDPHQGAQQGRRNLDAGRRRRDVEQRPVDIEQKGRVLQIEIVDEHQRGVPVRMGGREEST
jgi:hypothetical protein